MVTKDRRGRVEIRSPTVLIGEHGRQRLLAESGELKATPVRSRGDLVKSVDETTAESLDLTRGLHRQHAGHGTVMSLPRGQAL
jgi:hypothetical protein